jgi:hypothetical protein
MQIRGFVDSQIRDDGSTGRPARSLRNAKDWG